MYFGVFLKHYLRYTALNNMKILLVYYVFYYLSNDVILIRKVK